jgi:hypothetical protein
MLCLYTLGFKRLGFVIFRKTFHSHGHHKTGEIYGITVVAVQFLLLRKKYVARPQKTFRKLDLFPSSGEGTETPLCWFP